MEEPDTENDSSFLSHSQLLYLYILNQHPMMDLLSPIYLPGLFHTKESDGKQDKRHPEKLNEIQIISEEQYAE